MGKSAMPGAVMRALMSVFVWVFVTDPLSDPINNGTRNTETGKCTCVKSKTKCNLERCTDI